MIAYVDSSVVARAHLPDEDGHEAARRLLDDPSVARFTGRWTPIEVSGALVRAARAGRIPSAPRGFVELDADLRSRGLVQIVTAPHDQVERAALRISREHGLRALDALHLAVAAIVLPKIAHRGEPLAFASRDGEQAVVARELGLEPV